MTKHEELSRVDGLDREGKGDLNFDSALSVILLLKSQVVMQSVTPVYI